MGFFIPEAAAAEAANGGPGMGYMDIVFIGMIVLVFYFIIWRPQSKRAKEHRELVGGLSKGDEVVTNGGIIGKVHKVDEQFLVVEVANNVHLKMQKGSVAAAVPKGTIKSID